MKYLIYAIGTCKLNSLKKASFARFGTVAGKRLAAYACEFYNDSRIDCRLAILQYVEAVKTVSKTRIKIARAIAVCADLVQIGLPMVFGEGVLSPFQDAVDLVVCITLTLLVGWHFAFLPSFVVKLVPIVDLAPTWTIAIFVATRKSRVAPPPEPTMKRAVVTEDKPVT